MNELRRALTGTAEQPTLTFERTYRASLSELRDACTDPDRLARWFGTIEGEPAGVGDAFTALLSDDEDDRANGTVLACDERVIQFSWSWQGEAESTVTARFIPVDAQHTQLMLTHSLSEPDHAVGYGGGWEDILHQLSRQLTGGDGDAGTDDGDPGTMDADNIEARAVERWREVARRPLVVERVISADRERVWDALTTAPGLKSWWWSHWPDVEVEAHASPGGTYRIAAPAAGIVLTGTYIAVDRPEHLAFTWTWTDDDGTARDEAVDIALMDRGDGRTRVIVRHTGPWADDDAVDNYRTGWNFTLDQLNEALT